MPNIEDESIDLVLADLPYGATHNKWDKVIDLDSLFKQYERIIKPHGAVLLFGMSRFGANLIQSETKKLKFRYDWVWEKENGTNFLWAHHAPLRIHENIYVFYKHLPTYNPQMRLGFKPYNRTRNNQSSNYRIFRESTTRSDGERYPVDVLKYTAHAFNVKKYHPTQKPISLLEYLIKTYTNEGDLVLDNTMGGGSTGVACVNTKRDFIGMELEQKYFDIARKRINEASKNIQLI